MGKKKAIQAFLLTILCVSLTTAASLPITVNVDAKIEVTPKDGGGMQTFDVVGGEKKDLSITWTDEGWQNTESDCDFKIISKNNFFTDTSFTHNVSTNWNGALDLTLPKKPLPTDTAFIPVRSNVDVTITAKPIKMIKGGNPTDDFTFTIPKRTLDTLRLPVETNITIATLTDNTVFDNSVKFTLNSGRIDLSLPTTYLNSAVSLFSVSGKVIGTMNLTSQFKNSLSIWDVAAGVYILHIKSKNNVEYTKRFSHTGGRVLLATSFNKNSSSLLQSESRSEALLRAATATYDFIIDAKESNYNDTTIRQEFTGQMNGMRSFYLIDPNDTSAKLDQLVDEIDWEKLFPNRYGLGYGAYINDPLPEDTSKIQKLASDGDYDFYTYESLEKALANMSEIEVDLYQLEGHNYMHRIVWRNKKSGETRTMVNNVEYENYKKTSTENLIQTIDYGNFCSEGDITKRKQELAAFFGNISHETTGAGTEEKSKTWGLYWREEAAWQKGSTALGYVDEYPNELYKPSSNQSYHGRGPIQITHNVNYGQLSEFFYGDKQILLDNPGKLVPKKPEDATVAFMSAIWFWMTPQAPKPSCHDIMVGNWTANSEEAAKNWDKSKFGMTVFVINGGQECGNNNANDDRVVDRTEFYRRYCTVLGVADEDYCGCETMKP